MFGRALTSVFWGFIADRYGRKPVVMFGVITVLVELDCYHKFDCSMLKCAIDGPKCLLFFCFWHFRVIFNTVFGLSTNFWMAISTRFLLGSLSGILGPMRVCFSLKI